VTEVILYNKPGCHLCEAVGQVIAQAARQRPFRLVVKDITQDAEDFRRYETEIPVVLVNGREVARYRLELREFLAALEGAG
jgi:glutaredoxin